VAVDLEGLRSGSLNAGLLHDPDTHRATCPNKSGNRGLGGGDSTLAPYGGGGTEHDLR
jgi:hypothetical protein